MNKQRIISIGRECGSGGHEIARALAERLGIRMLDKELIYELFATDKRMVKAAVKFDETRRRSPLFSNSLEESVAKKQFDYLLQTAASGESFVIVGRCADHVLRDYPGLNRIFVRAELADRIARVRQRAELTSNKQAEELIERTDRQRKLYYNYYTNQKWGDNRHYDLLINSSRLGVLRTVDVIELFVTA